MRRGVVLVVATCAALLIAGCGNVLPADLFLLTRTGTVPGAKLTLLVDDGNATCNKQHSHEISSHQLLLARQVVRDLDGLKGNGDGDDTVGPADRNEHLKPQPGSIMSYVVRDAVGTVGFSDNSRHQPQVFYNVADLTRRIAIGVCGLMR